MSPTYESDCTATTELLQDGHPSPSRNDDGEEKPPASYITLIAKAIMSTPYKRMLLSEIYQWIAEKYPYFRFKDRSWRNSVRHNLSLNECFVKTGRSENGKGNYWTIHPANVEDFTQGDFRRRRARRRVRKCEEMQRLQYGYPEACPTQAVSQCSTTPSGYAPMTTSFLPVSVLADMFGIENVTSKEEQLKYLYGSIRTTTLPDIDVSTTIPSVIPSILSPISPSSPSEITPSINSVPGQVLQACPVQNNLSVTVDVNANNFSQIFPSPISVEDLKEWN